MQQSIEFTATRLFRFEAIGTHWEIETLEPLPLTLQQQVADHIEQFDKTYSRFRPDSLVRQLAQAPRGGRYEFPADARPLFDLYDQLHYLTYGAVDPLVGRQLEQLGYDRHYSFKPLFDKQLTNHHDPDAPRWATDVVRQGTTLITRRPLVIDVGAAGKGYLVDIVSALLREAGVAEFIVDAGGDIRHQGPLGVRIGLEHPLDPERVIGVVPLHDEAICASATNRRAWGQGLHHVLDARSGAPTNAVLATWVVAPDALTADGLATALFFTSADSLQHAFDFTSVRMFGDRTVEQSRNFAGELFFA